MAEISTQDAQQPAAAIREPLSDVNSTALLLILLSGALAVADIIILVVVFHLNSARAEFDRQVGQVSYHELQEYRAQQTLRLNTYGRSPNQPGAFTIPIDEAMKLYAAEQAGATPPAGASAAPAPGKGGP